MNAPSQIFFATKNPGKQLELERLAQNFGVEVIFPEADFDDSGLVEDGKTFEENARKKAVFYRNKVGGTDMVFVGDDSGFEIPYLNNEPGVKSRRWLGYVMTDDKMRDHTLKVLEGVKGKDRRAVLKTTLVAIKPSGEESVYSGEIWGRVSKKPFENIKPIKGFPFRSIFIIDKTGKPIAHMHDNPGKEKTQRQIALEKMFSDITG